MTQGFTLVELLVVVLIIGILTAIALPEYTLSVERSRSAEAMINGKAIMDAMARHKQMYPGATVFHYSQIADLTMTGGVNNQTTWNSQNQFKTKNFFYQLGSDEVTMKRCNNGNCGTNGELYTITFKYNNDTGGTTHSCEPDGIGDPGGPYVKVCTSIRNM